jgi:hypothetical protein
MKKKKIPENKPTATHFSFESAAVHRFFWRSKIPMVAFAEVPAGGSLWE